MKLISITAALRSARSREIALSFGLQVAGAGLGYASQVVLARVLTAAPYGAVSATVSLSTIVGLVTTLGTGGLALRYLPQFVSAGDSESRDVFIAFAYRLATVASLGTCLLGLGVAVGVMRQPAPVVLAAAALCVATALWNLGGDIGRAIGRFAMTYGVGLVARPAIAIACMVVVSWSGFTRSTTTGLLALLAGGVFAIAVQVGVIARGSRFPGLLWKWGGHPRSWIREAPHYLMANGFVLLLLQADMLVSAYFLPSESLGYYSAASKSVGVLSVVSVAIGTVVVPRIAASSGDVGALGAEARSATRWQMILVVFASVPLLVFAPEVLSLFGSGFSDAAWALRILVLGQVVNMAFGPGGTLLVYTGSPQVATMGYAVSVVIAALACGVGANFYGLAGAALGSAAGVICAGMLQWYLARRYTGVGASIWSSFRQW